MLNVTVIDQDTNARMSYDDLRTLWADVRNTVARRAYRTFTRAEIEEWN